MTSIDDETINAWVDRQLAERPPLTPEQAALIVRVFGRREGEHVTDTPGPEDWKRLGKAIEDRRFRLDLSQEALVERGGPSHQTVRSIERGEKTDYRATTFRKFDRALGWPDGTSFQILMGAATAPPDEDSDAAGDLDWGALGAWILQVAGQ